jgi:hypothetical protein
MTVSEYLFAATMAMLIVWIVTQVGENTLRPITELITPPPFQGRKSVTVFAKSVLLVDDAPAGNFTSDKSTLTPSGTDLIARLDLSKSWRGPHQASAPQGHHQGIRAQS